MNSHDRLKTLMTVLQFGVTGFEMSISALIRSRKPAGLRDLIMLVATWEGFDTDTTNGCTIDTWQNMYPYN